MKRGTRVHHYLYREQRGTVVGARGGGRVIVVWDKPYVNEQITDSDYIIRALRRLTPLELLAETAE